MGYVKLSGTTNRHENWTTEIVLERDDETGEVTKSVKAGEPVDLSKADQDKLEGLGFTFEKSSKEELDQYRETPEAQQPVGADVSAAAPLLTPSSGTADQTAPSGDKND